LRTVRIRIGEILSGVEPGQQEIEILTGLGGGDCGYPFETGAEYVIYAYNNSDGHLETGICSRTRPLPQAADDMAYFHSMASASSTGTLRVQTGFSGRPGLRGIGIIAEQGGSRYHSLTNDAGEAVFTELPAGKYKIHAESDGDLPDDPEVLLGSKGCASLTLFRALRLVGRVTTLTGEPAVRIAVEFRSMTISRAFADTTLSTGATTLAYSAASGSPVGASTISEASRNSPSAVRPPQRQRVEQATAAPKLISDAPARLHALLRGNFSRVELLLLEQRLRQFQIRLADEVVPVHSRRAK
jgi:hypothetical protein